MRRLIAILLIFILCFALSSFATAASAQVETLTAQVDVQENGSCIVTITANVQFSSTETEFTIPLAKNADDITASGASFEIDDIDDVECVIFESRGGFKGNMTFTCSYSLSSVVKDGETAQTVVLNLPEKGWAFPIKNYDLTITFPTEISGFPNWYSAYHGVDIENYLDISIDQNVLHAKSLERFKDSETVRVELKFAANTFDLSHQPGQTASVATILFWLLVICAVGYRFFRLRGKHLRPILRQTAVNESTAGEIPCQLFGSTFDLVGTLAHWGNLGYVTIERKRNGRILLHKQMDMDSERSALERKLFYSIFRSSYTVDALEPRILTISKKVGVLIRSSWARRLFSKETGNPFTLRLIGLTASAVASMLMFDLMLPANLLRWFLLPILTALGVLMNYFIQSACLSFYARRRNFALLCGIGSFALLILLSMGAGCFAFMLMNIILQAFCAITTMFGGLRNESAQQLVRQTLGLRSFLQKADAQSLQRLSRSDSQYFYRMLPFAEQLGVASAFSRRCSALRLEPCPWLADDMSNANTAPEFYTAYSQIAALIRNEPMLSHNAVRSAPSEVKNG